ncbi:hypothetical protein BG004_007378 [Podila humilis]|nr:hypothetical protein BG004_007378 [Podila humilis]
MNMVTDGHQNPTKAYSIHTNTVVLGMAAAEAEVILEAALEVVGDAAEDMAKKAEMTGGAEKGQELNARKVAVQGMIVVEWDRCEGSDTQGTFDVEMEDPSVNPAPNRVNSAIANTNANSINTAPPCHRHNDNFYDPPEASDNPCDSKDPTMPNRNHHQQPHQEATMGLFGQPFTILHPALSTVPVPSTVAPSIYALASTVPFPTISQLSMNIPSNPTPVEKVTVPFKTILRSLPQAAVTTTKEHNIRSTYEMSDLQQMASIPFHSLTADTHQVEQGDTSLKEQGVHPSFASAESPSPRPASAQSPSSAGMTLAADPAPPSSTQLSETETGTDTHENLSPPPSATTTPAYQPVHDHSVPKSAQRAVSESPQLIMTQASSRKAKETATDANAEIGATGTVSTASTPTNNGGLVGSRITVFGFAPLFNSGDHANMQMSEERILQDGSLCQTLPFLNAARSASLSDNSDQGVSRETGGNQVRSENQSLDHNPMDVLSASTTNPSLALVTTTTSAATVGGGDGRVGTENGTIGIPNFRRRASITTLSAPHARAGISPALDLDQRTEEDCADGREQSVESLVNSKDWRTTGLGPRSSWPPELSMLLPVLMRSASPLAVYWGDQGYLIYNDAWRPILKQKHPLALGAPGATVWSEIWDVIGAQMEQVRRNGRGSDNKGLRLDLHREGYEEECYFDFTFSPIFLGDGSVGGILAFVQEVTQSILNQRRLVTLNQFSKQAPLIQSVSGAYSMITTILHESNNLDVPFSIVYKTKEIKETSTAPSMHQETFSPQPASSSISSQSTSFTHQKQDIPVTGPIADMVHGPDSAVSKIRLIRSHFSVGLAAKKDSRRVPQAAILCSTSFDRNLEIVSYGGVKEKVFSKASSTRHIPDSLLITPEEYEPLDPSAPVYDDPWAWPVRSVLADGIPRLVTLPKSTHKLARALLLPILENPSVLDSRITTVLIVGINPYQMLDSQYLDFLALLVANIASLLHFGQSREEERKSTEALFELNKAKISFFQNVSHELRTPLTLMLAPLDDVISQTSERSPLRPSLEMIRRNSRRLLKLVNTLLQFSRIEAGKGLAVFEETDLVKATREISANFESIARGFSLEYNINCENLDGLPGGVWVDRAMWGGIILNLIGNAFKHTWEGSVTVHQYPCKGKSGRDGVAVDVKDTGVGIAPEHLHTLFGRFNRIENKQSRSHEGTGIGLSLVKELTELHGGTVSVTSEVDKGTCFCLWIPAGRSHHPSAQVKLNDSQDSGNTFLQVPATKEIMNNKTDASMYVEEAAQWIAQKSMPGSTLTASGTDSTEEERPEEDHEAIGLEYIRDRHVLMEANQEFEVSTNDLNQCELSKILIDPSEVSDDVYLPENSLISIDPTMIPSPRRSSSTSHSPRTPLVDPCSFGFMDQIPKDMVSKVPEQPDNSVNDDGGGGDETRRSDVVDDIEDDATALPRVRSRRGYIIVVDDNNDMRAYLREILGKDFRVRCAVDGVDAIRLITERLYQGKRIDLVLSDVAMPNMNGYELLKRLRSDPATMMMPFILLSARAGEEANVEGLDLGADDCLVKPFSARELLARVRSTIRLSDLRHELIREQRHAFEMKQLIYNISVRIRSGLSLPEILDTASRELFKVIRCNAIRICRFRSEDPVTGQHWVRFVSEIVRVGKPKVLTATDRLLPKGLEIPAANANGEYDHASDLRHVSNYQHPTFGAKSFISVGLMYNRKVWGYLLASKDVDMVDWSQSEKMLFEQTGTQISLAIAHASLWELKKSQQVEMEAAHAASEAKSQILANTSHELRTPIGAIVGALSALEDTDQNLTGEQRDMVKIMKITSDVALSVINDLLDTAQLEAGAMGLNNRECHGLIETLEHSVGIFADNAGMKEVDLIMESSEDLDVFESSLQYGAAIWTDGDRLQQVIMNLIGNAVKFTSQGKILIQCSVMNSRSPLLTEGSMEGQSPVHVQSPQMPQVRGHGPTSIPPDAHVSYGTFRFEVTDTGVGIDPDFLKNHIFKSFAQFDQTMTRRFGGTGLVTTPGVSSPQRSVLAHRLFLAPEVASNARAVVVEPVTEARNVLGWVLNQHGVHATVYENCENVVQDERNRNPDLLGPDGAVLARSYRPNAHFFFCTRSNTAEATVETARALGEIFKERNIIQREQGAPNYKDMVVSIVLVVFSSPRGRSLAKDMMKRIRAHGLDGTVQCRYIVKPVKSDRVVECLQPKNVQAPPLTQGIGSGEHSKHLSSEGRNQTPGKSVPSTSPSTAPPPAFDAFSTVLTSDMATGSVSIEDDLGDIAQRYDQCTDWNRNTPESIASSSSNLVSPSENVPDRLDSATIPATGISPGDAVAGSTSSPSRMKPPIHRPATSTQKRLRTKSTVDGPVGNKKLPTLKRTTSTTDESSKSASDNPAAFSNRSARAAAGKRERKGKCILCVEDNIINLRVVQYQLQKLGYETQSACDGQVAVDMIKAQIEMLGQSVSRLELSEEATDGQDVVMSSDKDKVENQISQAQSVPVASNLLDMGNSLMMISESNANKSHCFGHPQQPQQSDSWSASSHSSPSMSASPRIDQSLVDQFPSLSRPRSVHSTASGRPIAQGPSTPTITSPNIARPPRIDLILMDCAMPVKSGFDAASEIRTMGQRSLFAAKIPIIALTASAVPSTKEKCLAAGMNGYLSKPTKLSDLEAMLDQWIQ